MDKHIIQLKLILIFFGVMSISLGGYAEDFGIKGGITSTELIYSEEFQVDGTLTGLKMGIFGNLKLSGPFSAQIEGYYVQKGNSLLDSIKFKIDYLEFPLLIRFDLPVRWKVKPNLFIGWYLAFRSNAKLINSVRSSNQNHDIKSTDSGLVIGGGIEFKVKKINLLFDVRYTRSSGSIILDPFGQESIQNRGISLMTGILFSLKGKSKDLF